MNINDLFAGFWDIFDKIIIPIKGKKVVLFGYSRSGYFIEQILKIRYGIEVDFIVDNKAVMFGRPIDRINIFDYLCPKEAVVLLTMSRGAETEARLEKEGYVKGENLFNLKEMFLDSDDKVGQIGILEWLERERGVNLVEQINVERQDKDKNAMNSSATRQIGLKRIIDELQIKKEDALLDMGAGLGAALILFRYYGFESVGGIELFCNIYETAKNNISKLGIDNIEIFNKDASKFDDLDNYNYFFFYNPFQGSTFDKVIENIENSYKKNKRKITIIYANPYCHKSVIKNGIFNLDKQIETDFDCRLANIYITKENDSNV